METDHDKMSYSVGLKAGSDLKMQFRDLNIETFKKGFMDALDNRPSSLKDAELVESLKSFQKQKEVKEKILLEHLAKKNEDEGEKFLEENMKKMGVLSTNSGLQYKVLKRGNGITPGIKSKVTLHYKGSLLNGTVFDDTFKRNQPVELLVSATLPGWSEALKKMKEGDKWQLFIPSYLAYGIKGFGRYIEPNAALIFELELLKVV